jgi:hypothetical protein
MMAVLQAMLTMVFQQAGRVLNTVFGWATTLLFGQVPEKRQLYLSVIALGAVLWLAVVIGIAFPSLGTFLLALVPLSDRADPNWVRLAMLAAALLIPPIVGFVSLFLVDPADRPQGLAGKAKAILKGYPYTVGLAVTLVWMIVFAPVMKIRDVFRRWTGTHVPVVVRSEDYFDVLRDVERVLRDGGIETSRARASWMLRWPTRVFTFFAGGGTEDLVAKELTVLKYAQGEVLLHPSDLIVRGREESVTRVHALITEHLAFTKAYLTWSKEANQVEDRLEELWNAAKGRADDLHTDQALTRLQDLERDLKGLKVSYQEWEVLFREKLLVERALLRAAAGLTDQPQEGGEGRQPQAAHRGRFTI